MNIIEQLKSNLFLNEYPKDFKLENVDFKYPHTNLRKEIIEAIFKNIKSDFYLEIGSMHGASAILVAEYIKEKNLKTKIVCIDPFCGDINMWLWEKEKKINNEWSFLNLKNGRPQIYETFLSNIKFTNNENIILPIFCTSLIGTDLIRKLYSNNKISFLPNIIYLDSAHIEGETLLEIKKCYDLLPPGGILYGDDFNWDSIQKDLKRFISYISINTKLCYTIKESLKEESFILDNKILIYRPKDQPHIPNSPERAKMWDPDPRNAFWMLCK